jgi:hypothetical protein
VNVLVRRVGDIDASFLRSQQGGVAGGPLLIVDGANKQLTFLGHQFRFDQFVGHAHAGLKCFLFLTKHPQTWFPRSAIVEGAGIEVELEQLPVDISNFRTVVKPATTAYAEHFAGRQRHEAELSFIVAEKTPRHGSGAEGHYKLAIDPDRIEHRG